MRTVQAILAGWTLAAATLSACSPAGEERPVGIPGPAVAAALSFADSALEEAVASESLPGAVLLVARDGRVLHEKAYGYAKVSDRGRRLQRPEPMTVGHAFDLASVTKVMATTMAIMLLADRGLVELDEPVHTYLPDFRGADKDRITVRDLLTHRSGLHRWKPVYFHAATPQEAYAYIRDLPLEFGVGEGRHYSDLGFMLAGYIVEEVAGRSLDAYLREELYRPLGLTRTGFAGGRRGVGGPFAATSHGNPYERRMVEDDTFGYLCDEDPAAFSGWRTHTLLGEVNDGNAWHAHGGVAGHAGLFSTASDLGVLLGLLLQEGQSGRRTILGAGAIREFLTPDALTGNGVGWAMSRLGTGEGGPEVGVFSHTGFTGTYVMGAPELGLAVVFLSNRQNLGVDAASLYPDAARVYLPIVRRIVAAAAGEEAVEGVMEGAVEEGEGGGRTRGTPG